MEALVILRVLPSFSNLGEQDANHVSSFNAVGVGKASLVAKVLVLLPSALLRECAACRAGASQPAPRLQRPPDPLHPHVFPSLGSRVLVHYGASGVEDGRVAGGDCQEPTRHSLDVAQLQERLVKVKLRVLSRTNRVKNHMLNIHVACDFRSFF